MTRWYTEKKREYYYKKAKKEKYRSRAVYKLQQLNKKFDLIRKGYRILDLGAAPGGWMQAGREIVGNEGFVLGVDLDEIEDFKLDNVKSIQGDFTKEETLQAIKSTIGKADTIISDASPDISGVWEIDHFKSVDLCRYVLKIAEEVLKAGGNFVVKVFQGKEADDFFAEIRTRFEFAKRTKPMASRGSSAEIYIVGKGFKYSKGKD